jgi:hypothetical protein
MRRDSAGTAGRRTARDERDKRKVLRNNRALAFVALVVSDAAAARRRDALRIW